MTTFLWNCVWEETVYLCGSSGENGWFRFHEKVDTVKDIEKYGPSSAVNYGRDIVGAVISYQFWQRFCPNIISFIEPSILKSSIEFYKTYEACKKQWLDTAADEILYWRMANELKCK